MRRVNIRYGLKQRMGDILGADSGLESDPGGGQTVPGITAWSIQAAMMENIKRIVKALVGGASVGRPMKGLLVSSSSDTTFNISSGFGFTNDGDVVVIEVSLESIPIITATGSTVHIYLKHLVGVLDGDLYPDGKKSTFIRGPAENIVYDDYAASKKMDVNNVVDEIVVQSETELSDDNLIYLGYIELYQGKYSSFEENSYRGLSPNINGGYFAVENFRTKQFAEFLQDATFSEYVILEKMKHPSGAASTINVESKMQFGEDITCIKNLILASGAVIGVPGDTGHEGPTTISVSLAGGGTSASISVKKGIVTDITVTP